MPLISPRGTFTFSRVLAGSPSTKSRMATARATAPAASKPPSASGSACDTAMDGTPSSVPSIRRHHVHFTDLGQRLGEHRQTARVNPVIVGDEDHGRHVD